MNKLVKILESIGQTDSVHQNNQISHQLSKVQIKQLLSSNNELKCAHHPGDDDDED